MTSCARSSTPGGTLVDTAYGYGGGSAEEILGRLVGDVVPRDDVVLCTKAGIERRGEERVVDTSRRALLRQLDTSLSRLGVDHVDLWLVHAWSDAAPLEETVGAMAYAVSSGRATYVGVSNYSGWQTARAMSLLERERVPLVANEIEYSLLQRAPRTSSSALPRLSGSVSCRGRRSDGASSRASTATASRRTPGRRRATSPGSPRGSSTSGAPGSPRPSPRPPAVSRSPPPRWRSPGCATVRGSRRRSSVPAPWASCAPPSRARTSPCPARSSRRSTRSRPDRVTDRCLGAEGHLARQRTAAERPQQPPRRRGRALPRLVAVGPEHEVVVPAADDAVGDVDALVGQTRGIHVALAAQRVELGRQDERRRQTGEAAGEHR